MSLIPEVLAYLWLPLPQKPLFVSPVSSYDEMRDWPRGTLRFLHHQLPWQSRSHKGEREYFLNLASSNGNYPRHHGYKVMRTQVPTLKEEKHLQNQCADLLTFSQSVCSQPCHLTSCLSLVIVRCVSEPVAEYTVSQGLFPNLDSRPQVDKWGAWKQKIQMDQAWL